MIKRISAVDFDSESYLAKVILTYLRQDSGVIVSNLLTDVQEIDTLKMKLCGLCEQVGIVSTHNNNDTPVWDILASDTNSQYSTFSEHANEAELHTDSQYRQNPEDYFALHCVRQARCGGGLSLFLSVNDIVKELNQTPGGRLALNFFENNVYPYIVPDIFKVNRNGPPEYTFGYLIKKGEMRFRIDTVEKAIALDPSLCSDAHLLHFNTLKQVILNSEHIITDKLKNNECLFINNKTMLHGRTEFEDKQRHLLRIRFYEKEGSELID